MFNQFQSYNLFGFFLKGFHLVAMYLVLATTTLPPVQGEEVSLAPQQATPLALEHLEPSRVGQLS